MTTLLTANFTLEEMVFSQTAARRGIDNTPPAGVQRNLRRLCQTLELLRPKLGNMPIMISSGYRSPALNMAVGGSSKSLHMQGLAVDFVVPRFGSTFQVANAVATSGLAFDQVIHEYGSWVHLGLAPDGAEARSEKLSIFAGTGYLPGLVPAAG